MRLRVGGSGCPGAGGNERASLFHCLGLDRRALSLRIRGRRFESYRSAMFRAVQNNTWDLARTRDLHSRGAMSPTLFPGACNGSPTCPHRAVYRAAHPFCADCGEAAEVVDHDTSHRGDAAIFWDKSRSVARCKRDHDRKSATCDCGFGRGRQATGQASPEVDRTSWG